MVDLVVNDALPESILADPVAAIVARNLETGRFDRVCDRAGRRLALAEYTQIIATYYAAHHAWVERLAAGDRGAWTEQWRMLYGAAYGMLQRAGWAADRAAARAQEAAQDTCTSLYCRTFPYDCPYDGWAFTILRRQVFSFQRRPHSPLDRPDCLELGEDDVAVPGPEQALDYDEAVLAAVEDLPSAKQREVIYCLFFHELGPSETAAHLGCSRQAVYNAKHRALGNLARRLAAQRGR